MKFARQVYYMHTHKSGGSTLCALAAANGVHVDLASNCQEMEGGQRVAWWGWSSWRQAELFKASPHGFISNEDNPFLSPPMPGAIIYVITVCVSYQIYANMMMTVEPPLVANGLHQHLSPMI